MVYMQHIARMNNHEPMNKVLADLRDKAGLTQAQLAEQLSINASKLSRLEAGLTELTKDDAREIAAKIPSEEARNYADYLGQEWSVTPKPSFRHVSLPVLWRAEQALQRVLALEND